MRPAAQRLRFAERGLGAVEVAEPAPHFAELHVSGRGVGAAHTDQLGARALDFLLRPRPLTPTLKRPRAMHATQSGEQRGGVPLRPTRRRVGPLRGAAIVAQRLARADQAAIDLAGRVRTEPSFDREQHRFVEVRQAFTRLPLVDQDATQSLQRLRLQIGHAEAPTELDDRTRVAGREMEVASAVRDLDVAQQEHAVLGAVAVVVDLAMGALQPRTPDVGLRLEAVVLVEPRRAPRRPPGRLALVEDDVGGLASLDALVDEAEPPGGLGPGIEPARVVERIGIRPRSRRCRGVVRGLPVVAGEGVTGRFQRSGGAGSRTRFRGAHGSDATGEWRELPTPWSSGMGGMADAAPPSRAEDHVDDQHRSAHATPHRARQRP